MKWVKVAHYSGNICYFVFRNYLCLHAVCSLIAEKHLVWGLRLWWTDRALKSPTLKHQNPIIFLTPRSSLFQILQALLISRVDRRCILCQLTAVAVELTTVRLTSTPGSWLVSCVLNKYTHSQNEIELNINSSINKLNMICYAIGYMI